MVDILGHLLSMQDLERSSILCNFIECNALVMVILLTKKKIYKSDVNGVKVPIQACDCLALFF